MNASSGKGSQALETAAAIEESATKTRLPWLQSKAGSGVQFLAGAAIVVLGSRLLVDGAVNLADRLG